MTAAILERALAEHRAGELAAAETLYRQALAVDPHQGEARGLLGACLQQQGRHAEAVAELEQAASEAPAVAIHHHNVALSLRQLGRAGDAEAAFRRALAIDPGFAPAQSSLGNLLKASGRFDEALALQTAAATANPDVEGLWRNLRLTYEAAGRADAGREALAAAAARFPASAAVHDALAAASLAAGCFDAAANAATRALELAPHLVSARVSLASATKERGDLDGAIALLRGAISRAPQDADARWNLALAQLQAGQHAEGWAGLEWRRRIEGLRPALRAGVPEWDGRRLRDGDRLLLVTEQGLGDAIQFVRYAAVARDRGAHVVVESRPALARLLRGADGVDEVIATGTAGRFEAQAPSFSLPALCGPPPTGISAVVPYLRAEPALVERWASRVRAGEPALRVGLAWQGNPRYRADARRSIGLTALLPLARIPGVRLFALQHGEAAHQLAEAGRGAIDPLAAELDQGRDAFIDTAAALMHLDLLISSDTSLPHLGGALGRPVWLLLPHVPDWRWGLTGDTTPWYPNMRLFRQDRPGDWAGVVDRVAAALREQRTR